MTAPLLYVAVAYVPNRVTIAAVRDAAIDRLHLEVEHAGYADSLDDVRAGMKREQVRERVREHPGDPCVREFVASYRPKTTTTEGNDR